MSDCPLMFDKDVAALFGINVQTLQRRVKKPVPGEVDLNRAEPQIVGGRRFWVRSRVLRLIGAMAAKA